MNKIEQLAQYIKDVNKISILTGAGISTESGIPDFRSSQGIWTHNLSRQELMSRGYLLSYPEKFWPVYKDIFKIKMSNQFEPNYGHIFLAELEQYGKDIEIYTQNVDGLHQAAGSTKVFEVHGTMKTASCNKCSSKYDLNYINQNEIPRCNNIIHKKNTCNNFIVVKDEDAYAGVVTCDACNTTHEISRDTFTLRCKGSKEKDIHCSGYLRPDVVLFGDMINYYLEAKKSAVASELFMVIGSSLQVGPINEIPIYTDSKRQKRVLITRDRTEFDSCFDLVINEGIGDTFRKVKELL